LRNHLDVFKMPLMRTRKADHFILAALVSRSRSGSSIRKASARLARFQAIEIAGQDQRDPLILADADAWAIGVNLCAADALPAIIKFHHGLDSAS
jgi:hypothetical protein